MKENIDWYCGDGTFILSVEPKGEFVFNSAFSNELKRSVTSNSMSIYPKVAFAIHDGCLLVKVFDNEGFRVIRSMEYGNAVLSYGESTAVLEKFGNEILGEWKFERVNDYYKGRKISKGDTKQGILTIVK